MSKTEDEDVFGFDAFVYCDQHLRPHRTGWCTVPARNKTMLGARTIEHAYTECRDKGLKIYSEEKVVWHPVVRAKRKVKAHG